MTQYSYIVFTAFSQQIYQRKLFEKQLKKNIYIEGRIHISIEQKYKNQGTNNN